MAAAFVLVILLTLLPGDVRAEGTPGTNEALRFDRVQFSDRVGNASYAVPTGYTIPMP